jgi:serine/threonine protein kinase/Flp pilus assembly protein TadD
VFSTTALPNSESLERTPPPRAPLPARRPASWGDDNPDGPPTVRVPVPRPLPLPGQEPGPLAATPPPAGDLKFSGSDWSEADGAGPADRRAPRVGDTLLGFKLVGELGRGAFARVFLAHQEALADRPVALKVTLRPTREAERLARLQHTNVVPVYSVHDAPPVQVICMPYLGRTTLGDLIRAYRIDHPSRHAGRKSTSARAGRTTASATDSDRASKAADSGGGSGAHRVPVWTWSADEPPPIVGDPRAVLEVLAQLAAGLAHAHARGILHLDIKPANVLLADTGEPMLFDFNLSFDAARPKRDLVGGTVPYMAVEQLLDMRDRGKGAIDARTDLYALGVLAFEMLTGAVPFPVAGRLARDVDSQVEARRAGPPSLRERNPAVTPAVEAIVRKLLAFDPADRYQSAGELRADVERHLNNLPLRYAREASARERFGKWRRRNPGLLWRLAAACLVGLTAGLGGVAQRRAEATARYEAVERARAARAGLDATRLDLVLPDDPTGRERGAKRAAELLDTYGLPGDAGWQTGPNVRRLPAPERAALAGDLGEIMALLAQAKWQAADARPESERHELIAEAWKLNAAARACFAGAVPAALEKQAAVLAPAAGEAFEPTGDAPADPADPRAAFLDAALGLAHGRYAVAAPLFDRVVAARPDHAAAQFCLAYCRQQSGQYQRALERYDAARVLLPNDPRPAYQRGLIYGVCKNPAKAEAEFTKALAADPDHADAYRYRGMARCKLGTPDKMAEAEADLTAAADRGAPPLFVHLVRAKVRDARGDRAGAAADRAAAAGAVPKTEADYFVRGWGRIDSDPAAALADFRRASQINPRSLGALQNEAHVLADKLKDNDGALVVATKVAELYPEFGPAVAGRAVVLARLGKRDEAHKEIEKARLLSDDPEVLYQAASVYAVTSKTNPSDRAKAIALLREALKNGYANLRGMATDGDLEPLRGAPEFQEIRRAAGTIFR